MRPSAAIRADIDACVKRRAELRTELKAAERAERLAPIKADWLGEDLKVTVAERHGLTVNALNIMACREEWGPRPFGERRGRPPKIEPMAEQLDGLVGSQIIAYRRARHSGVGVMAARQIALATGAPA